MGFGVQRYIECLGLPSSIEAISPVSVCSSRGMYYIALGHMKPGQEWMGEDT